MKIVWFQIQDAIKSVLKTFFASDLNVMSDEVRQILSNPEDAAKYKQAVDQIEKNKLNEITIELSDKSKLTLVQ